MILKGKFVVRVSGRNAAPRRVEVGTLYASAPFGLLETRDGRPLVFESREDADAAGRAACWVWQRHEVVAAVRQKGLAARLCIAVPEGTPTRQVW